MVLGKVLPLGILALKVVAELTDRDVSHNALSPLSLGLFGTPEVLHPIRLNVEGKIPKWVEGSLYRGAAGTWDIGNYTSEHWFDGFSRNHRFEISNGEVKYRNRNSSDELIDFIEETGLYPGESFGGDPCKATFDAMLTTWRDGINPVGSISTGDVGVSYIVNFPGLNNTSTNHGPFVTLVSTTDSNNLQQIDPTTLEPIELFSYRASHPLLDTDGRSAAHPVTSNGEVYNYHLNITTEEYNVFVINNKGVGRILATITDAPPAYLHSIFGTEHYVILVVWQADFDASKMAVTGNLLDSLKPWDPKQESLFYVIDKVKGGVLAKYTTQAFYAFHEINSFEDEKTGSIIIDLPIMKDYSFLEGSRMESFRKYIGKPNISSKHDIPGAFRRFRLPNYLNAPTSSNGSVISRPALIDFELSHKVGNIELPRINLEYAGKPYRYAYGVHIVKAGYFADSIVKVDIKTQKSIIWSPRVNHLPSEPIFVARPGGTAEDDGVLLTVALDSRRRQSSLVVLDAKNLKEIARARMPVVMGFGFHGVWGMTEDDVGEGLLVNSGL